MEKVEKTKQCKECCRDITEDDYNAYDGYCKICYKDKEQDVDYESCSEYDEEERKTNFIAHRIKDIAIIIIIIGIIAGIIMCTIIGGFGVLVIVGSIIPAIFIYGFGEIIQLLEDIKNKK